MDQVPQGRNSRLLTTREAAKLLGVSWHFLVRDRCVGRTIPFVKIGARAVRYRLADLEQYIASRVQSPRTA